MNASKQATEAQIEALNKFMEAAQTKVDEYEATLGYKKRPSKLFLNFGRKYIKVMKDNDTYPHPTDYCYVNLATGSIYKSAGRHGIQDKIERGNIYAPDHGARGVDWFGAVYVR